MRKLLVGFIEDGKSGGVDNYILNFIHAVSRKGLQIDLLTNEVDKELEERMKEYNARLFAIANLRHPTMQFRQVRALIKKERYEMVYLNISTSMDLIAAFAAKSCKVPRRILHSHSGGNDCESAGKRNVFNLLQKICKGILYRTGNEFYACSKTAGYWMYPAKIVESQNFHVVYNAVDREKFAYHEDIRERVRKEMHLDGKFVVGHVGNFCYQKNHEFLIRVFEALRRKAPDAVLLLVGKGIRFEQIQKQAEEAGLSKSVRFLGWRKDVADLFQVMDVFLLPSNFEGLPTVGIESQCTGLPCVMSDSITRETQITENCSFLSLNDTLDKWAETVLSWKGCSREDIEYNRKAKYYNLEAQKKQLVKLVYGGKHE